MFKNVLLFKNNSNKKKYIQGITAIVTAHRITLTSYLYHMVHSIMKKNQNVASLNGTNKDYDTTSYDPVKYNNKNMGI